MLQRVTLSLAINDDWDAGDTAQVYTDRGTGTLDMTRPLLAKPLDLFPGRHRGRGVGRQPVGIGRVESGRASRPRVRLGRHRVGITPVGSEPKVLGIAVDVPPSSDTWKFGIEITNRFGNVQAGPISTVDVVLSGTEPAPAASFAFVSYDGGSDQVTFSFSKDAE